MTAAFTTCVFFNTRQLCNLLVITTAQTNISSSVDREHVSKFSANFPSTDKNFECLIFSHIHDWLVLPETNQDLLEVSRPFFTTRNA